MKRVFIVQLKTNKGFFKMRNICMICSRKLNGSRTISCSTLLKHTGRPIYEVLKQLSPQEFSLYPSCSDRDNKSNLFISENIENVVKVNQGPYSECSQDLQNIVKIHKLCFRCYRLILGIDYHGFELGKLKGQISQLREVSIEKDERDTKDDILPINSTISGINNIETINDSINMHVVESIDKADKELIDDENNFLEEKFKTSEIELNTKPILNVAKPVFNSDCNTKRNRKCKRLVDFEYLDVNEKHISKKSLKENAENNSEEIRKDSDSKSKKKAPILCRKCHEKFKTKKSFNSHGCQKIISTIKKKAYSCKVCGIDMKFKQSYLEHVESCYKNIAVKCNRCPVKLPSAAFLPRHMEAFHEGEPVSSKEVLCDQCGREFTRKESLDRHQATVHGISYGQHQCPQCGRTFLHTSLLAEHMRAHRGYDCDQCTKTFSCASNLRLHLRTHHQNKHLYQCLKCNKHWKFHTSYIYHLRKVHGVNRHKCTRCRQHFSSEAEFAAHNNTCHKTDSNLKNKENESRLNTYNNVSKKDLQDENLLIKTDEMDPKTKNLNENPSLLKSNDLAFEPNPDCLPLRQPTKTAFNLVPQEILALRNEDVAYSKKENSSFKSRDITQELDDKDDIITNSQKLMIEEIVQIREPVNRGFDFHNRKEQVVYENNNKVHEVNLSDKMSSDMTGLQYVEGDMIEFDDNDNAPRAEYVELLASEDIVVESCEEYPPECQYVIIVEDEQQM